MEIHISENLVKFRKEKGNSQEKLADFLNISIPSVSKWERGECYPDITLLHKIASFYDVTVDQLLGVDEIQIQNKLNEYYIQDKNLRNKGNIRESLDLWLKAYKELPNNHDIKYQLMYAYSRVDEQKYKDQIIELATDILTHSTDSSLRGGPLQTLTKLYKSLGDINKAKKYAAMADNVYCCREQLWVAALDGEEKAEAAQYNILSFLDSIYNFASILAHNKTINRSISYKQKVLKSMLKIFEGVFEDGDYGFYSNRMYKLHADIAKFSAILGDDDKEILYHLTKAKEYAICFETFISHKFKSPLINMVVTDPNNTTKTNSKSTPHMMLEFLANSEFDDYRESLEFKQIIIELEINN